MAKQEKETFAVRCRSWFQGLASEFRKVIWTDRNTLIRQTIIVVLVSIVLMAIISIMDAGILRFINLLVK